VFSEVSIDVAIDYGTRLVRMNQQGYFVHFAGLTGSAGELCQEWDDYG
jgi:hypothetical protein